MSHDDIVLLIGIAIGCGSMGICAAKGKYGLATLALIFAIPAWFGACRLAKPGSWWWRTRYGHAKQRASWERFEQTPFPG